MRRAAAAAEAATTTAAAMIIIKCIKHILRMHNRWVSPDCRAAPSTTTTTTTTHGALTETRHVGPLAGRAHL